MTTKKLFILHLALGGCLKSPPISFGVTADTGGHIAYVLNAVIAQAALSSVERISIVTRLFCDDQLGDEHRLSSEPIESKITVDRIATANRDYLEKEALAADLPAFTDAFRTHLAALPRLPDVIHAHFADAAAVALAAREWFGVPVVYTPHALGIDKRAQQSGCAALDGRIAAERRAIEMSDAIIVSTRDEVERQLHAYGVLGSRARIRCIPPGVPHRAQSGSSVSFLSNLGDRLHDPRKPIVLAIARPVRKKNLAALVRAYAALPALADLANLVILAGQHGGGRSSAEEREVVGELEWLCADERLRGRVALPPRHSSADVAALYQQAATGGVFVNPALHEPFGLTLIEAATAGVPVVATRNGGPVEIVDTIGHGVLVDPRDEAAIGTACLGIISDPDLHRRLSQAGLRNGQRYNWSTYADQSVSLYASLHRAPRLLACDIDGTLTGCTSGARCFAAWQEARPLPFIVATGRSFSAACAVLEQWRLPQPDAFIVDVGTRIMLPAPDGGWRECPDYAARLDRDWDREAVTSVLAPLSLTPQPADTAGPHKLSFFGTASQAQAIRDTLATSGLKARTVFSHGRLIDVLAPHAGKAAAIAAYAARLGLTLADCIAAGDSGNDIDMLDACGYAIVVANATVELDELRRRRGLKRVGRRYASGVMEGLTELGVAMAEHQTVAA